MNYFQRLAATGSLAVALLATVPAVAIACAVAPRSVELSSVVVTSNDDGSGWTISFETPSDAPANASYIVATGDDAYCTASGTDTPGDVVSCDVPLLEDPSVEPTVSRIDLVLSFYNPRTYGFAVDASSATVTLNDDGSAWIVTFKTFPDLVTNGSYVVTTTDGSTCTVDAVDAVDGVISCEIGLLNEPEVAPEVANIRYFVFTPFTGGPALSVDVASATIALNADGTGWTVSWSELAAEGAQLPYMVISTNGDSCFADGTGVEGTQLSCDLPLMTDPSQTPELESIRTIEFMYDSRTALNGGTTSGESTNGVTTYVSTTIAPVGALQQASAAGLTDDLLIHEGGRSSAWVWTSGVVALLLGCGVLLRRKALNRSSSEA
jgi:hypothetical protein